MVEDPRLRYAVLAGLLNVATCPSCGRRAATVRPFVYSDVPHNLLAYVHPEADAPEEARQIILEKLRDVYMRVVDEQEAQPEEVSSKVAGASEIPPLRVIFGTDQLHELINASLSADERLGRLALSTHSRNEAERGQLLAIARKLALEMQCLVEEEDQPDEYIVWLYGSRRQIGALMRELTPRG
ncbi:MAG: CpXC domain-containing protein [Chloroflexota bacterium]|nr:CpXC domain-containing protein [Chloroflexota bacterium]